MRSNHFVEGSTRHDPRGVRQWDVECCNTLDSRSFRVFPWKVPMFHWDNTTSTFMHLPNWRSDSFSPTIPDPGHGGFCGPEMSRSSFNSRSEMPLQEGSHLPKDPSSRVSPKPNVRPIRRTGDAALAGSEWTRRPGLGGWVSEVLGFGGRFWKKGQLQDPASSRILPMKPDEMAEDPASSGVG